MKKFIILTLGFILFNSCVTVNIYTTDLNKINKINKINKLDTIYKLDSNKTYHFLTPNIVLPKGTYTNLGNGKFLKIN